jgi:hypothetical protein
MPCTQLLQKIKTKKTKRKKKKKAKTKFTLNISSMAILSKLSFREHKTLNIKVRCSLEFKCSSLSNPCKASFSMVNQLWVLLSKT